MIEDSKTVPGDPCDPNDNPEKEAMLDEAIADSMDASDPPSIVSKGQPTAPPRRPGQPEPEGAGQQHSGKSDRR